MQKITLQIANNGIIKTIEDDNINGAGESFESTVVYEFNTNQNKISFIEDICIDIGLEFGNSRSENQIQVVEGWGEHYEPTKEQIENKIKELSNKLKEYSKNQDG